MNLFDEVATTKRFLAEYAKLKKTHGWRNIDFLHSIGYQTNSASMITDMMAGRTTAILRLIVSTKKVYPEFDMDYVLMSEDVPEVTLPHSPRKGKVKYPATRAARVIKQPSQQEYVRQKEQLAAQIHHAQQQIDLLKKAGRKGDIKPLKEAKVKAQGSLRHLRKQMDKHYPSAQNSPKPL